MILYVYTSSSNFLRSVSIAYITKIAVEVSQLYIPKIVLIPYCQLIAESAGAVSIAILSYIFPVHEHHQWEAVLPEHRHGVMIVNHEAHN